jgi:hypothetical protein
MLAAAQRRCNSFALFISVNREEAFFCEIIAKTAWRWTSDVI